MPAEASGSFPTIPAAFADHSFEEGFLESFKLPRIRHTDLYIDSWTATRGIPKIRVLLVVKMSKLPRSNVQCSGPTKRPNWVIGSSGPLSLDLDMRRLTFDILTAREVRRAVPPALLPLTDVPQLSGDPRDRRRRAQPLR